MAYYKESFNLNPYLKRSTMKFWLNIVLFSIEFERLRLKLDPRRFDLYEANKSQVIAS